ncbi:MAG: hypothetical protein LBH47_01790, partial [Christensenellaceae bacterium]|nr:hypothetical protein [Christensenellaceae bacterium]
MKNEVLKLLGDYECPSEYTGTVILEDLLSILSVSKSLATDYKPAIMEIASKHCLKRNCIEKNLQTLILRWSE